MSLILSRYNSAIFPTTAVSEYYVVIVDQGFLQNRSFSADPSLHAFLFDGEEAPPNAPNIISQLQVDAIQGRLARLENKECIQKYSATLNTDYSNVVLVAQASFEGNKSNSLIQYLISAPMIDSQLYSPSSDDVAAWTCNAAPDWADYNQCSLSNLTENAATWSIGIIPVNSTAYYEEGEVEEVAIDYCLAQRLRPNSNVELDQST